MVGNRHRFNARRARLKGEGGTPPGGDPGRPRLKRRLQPRGLLTVPRQSKATPVRPVAVLDANALEPPGLADLLLSCAWTGVFRRVWQAEIEAELRRNSSSPSLLVRLTTPRLVINSPR